MLVVEYAWTSQCGDCDPLCRSKFGSSITVHANLHVQAEALLSEESYNTTATLALVEELIEVTVPDPQVPRSLFPSELNTSNIILTVAVDALIADFNQTGVADPAQV